MKKGTIDPFILRIHCKYFNKLKLPILPESQLSTCDLTVLVQ